MEDDKKIEVNLKNSKIKDKLIIAKRMRKKPSFMVLLVLTLLVGALYMFVGKGNFLSAKGDAKYTSEKKDHTKITFTGDVSPSRYLKQVSKEKGHDVFYKNTKKIWQDSDVTVANVEAAVVKEGAKLEDYIGKPDRNGIYLDVNEKDIKAIKNSGINLIGYANNHASDYGIKGMQESFKIFNQTGIDFTGAGVNIDAAEVPFTKEINGKKISISAITDKLPKKQSGGSNLPRTNNTSYRYADYELKKTFTQNDFNIVYVHWGTEYSITASKHIKNLGKKYIDLGADLVIGAHPHVVLPVEKYNGGIIAYSLGNFVFDQKIGRTTEAAVASLYMNENSKFLELVPIKINNGVPGITDSSMDLRSIHRMLTKYLNKSDYEIKDGKIMVKF